MEQSALFLISYILLWVVALCSVGMLVYMFQLFTKQSQYIEEKLKNIPDMTQASKLDDKSTLPLGTVFPKNNFITYLGEPQAIYPQKEGSIVLFASPGCSSCKEIYPVINDFQEIHPHLQVISLMQGEHAEVEELVQAQQLEVPVAVLDHDLMLELETFMFPVAYYLDIEGKVIAKALVNYEAQLYELLEMAKQNIEEGLIPEQERDIVLT